jgi:DNA-directed RNA polymerase subunit beta
LLKAEAPYVGTGMEYKAARDSGVMRHGQACGVVERVTADEIWIRHEEDGDGRIV